MTIPSQAAPEAEPLHDAFWAALEQLQNTFANQLRRHDAGQDIDPQRLVNLARDLVDRFSAHETDTVPLDQSVRELLSGYWEQVAQRRTCATTGFGRLNDALGGGLEAKRLLVLLGAPGSGKTTLTNQIADHVAASGRPVLYVTSEDMPFTLLCKTLARMGNVNYTAVLKGWDSERTKIQEALRRYGESASIDRLRYFDATMGGTTLELIRERARAHFEQYGPVHGGGPGLLVIDYLQRLARVQRAALGLRELREIVSLLTEQLRSLACELECTVIALASQNRASGYGANTSSSALASGKESGDIEYTADVMMALAEDTDPGRRTGTSFAKPWQLRIDKNRLGETTKILLDWQPDRQTFTEART